MSRRATLVLEPYDGLLARLGVILSFGPRYEHAAVHDNRLQRGGVANDVVPSFVHRFTRREITKICRAFYADGDPSIYCYHQFQLPTRQLELRRMHCGYGWLV